MLPQRPYALSTDGFFELYYSGPQDRWQGRYLSGILGGAPRIRLPVWRLRCEVRGPQDAERQKQVDLLRMVRVPRRACANPVKRRLA